jgi:glycosyltransferase involved in cell wall biosynthesis
MNYDQTKNQNLNRIWCVIPVYNNGTTLRSVALECRVKMEHVLVVDDGSTDVDVKTLLSDTDIIVLSHEKNKGKGQALLTALDYVSAQNARYMITIDADGQHKPTDLENFFPLLGENEDVLVVGCRDFTRPNVPAKSKFGRDLANFWLRIETGKIVNDCQSGFRAYPVKHFKALSLMGAHYDFETEALARAAWAGIEFKMVEIDVWYAEEGKRISSFRPILDNVRISLMHTRLVIRHLLPIPHKKLVVKASQKIDLSFLRHPILLLKELLKENATPVGLAASAGVGIILGTLPLLFTHTLAIIYVTSRLHLNKIMAVSIQNLCNPPLVPFLCIELGYFMQHGEWLTHVSKEAFLGEIPSLLWSWLLGSLVLAPVFALMVGMGVYLICRMIQKKEHASTTLCAGQTK